MFSIEILIDDQWVTPVYEHVHHGRCFSLLEESRVALLREIGFPNDELLAEGKVLVISGVWVRYRREVKRGRITVTCEDPVIDGRTLILKQRVLNDEGKVAIEARIESVFMDQNTRRGMNPPEDFATAFLAWSKG